MSARFRIALWCTLATVSMMPAFGMLWGRLLLDETITAPMFAGAALIVAGTAAVLRPQPRPALT